VNISLALVDLLAHRGRASIESVDGEGAIRGSNTGKCRLQIWKKRYRWKDAIPVDAKTQARFALGNAVHEETRALIAEAGFEIVAIEGEVSLTVAGREIPGHVDGIVRGEDGPELIDVKSVSAYPWKVASGLLTPKAGKAVVSEEHLDQLHFYELGLRGMSRGGTMRGRLLYRCIEKDDEAEQHPTFPYFDFPVEWDATRFARVRSRWEDVLAHPVGLPPAPDFGPIPEIVRGRETGRMILPFECAYCPFREGASGCHEGVVKDEMAARAKPWPRKGIYYFPTKLEKLAPVDPAIADEVLDREIEPFAGPRE